MTHRYSISHGVEAFELLRERKGVKALIIPSDQLLANRTQYIGEIT